MRWECWDDHPIADHLNAGVKSLYGAIVFLTRSSRSALSSFRFPPPLRADPFGPHLVPNAVSRDHRRLRRPLLLL